MTDILKQKRLMATWWLLSAFLCVFAQGTDVSDVKSSPVEELGVRKHAWMVGGGFPMCLTLISLLIYIKVEKFD